MTGTPELSPGRSAPRGMPLRGRASAKVELQSILKKYQSGQLANLIPLRNLFIRLHHNGSYAAFKEVYDSLDEENKEIFRKLISDPANHEMIFGKGKGIPQEIQEIISPKGKTTVPHPVTTDALRPVLQVQDTTPIEVTQTLPPDRILVKSAVEKNPLLKMFSESFITSGTIRDFPQEKVIIEQNSQSGEVYVVLEEGSVKVEIFDSTGKVIKTIYPPKGSLVGERSVMFGIATNARVTALTGAKLLALSGPTFLAFLHNAPRSPNFLGELIKLGISPKMAEEILERKVSIEVCRPGETVMIKDSDSRYMYIVLDGELGVFDYFGEVRGPDGNPVKIKPGEPVGEMELLNPDKKARSASVANTGSQDVVLLKIPRKTFKTLMKQRRSEFRKYIMRFYQQRSKAAPSIDVRAELKRVGFEYRFEMAGKDGVRVSQDVQRGILEAVWKIRSQILAVNPDAVHNTTALNQLLRFVCSSLELQHLDNPLKYVSHGADHSLNTMYQTIQLINGSEEVRTALGKKFGSVDAGRILAQLVALFHDIGYPEVTRLSESDPNIPKFRHQEFSADLVRKNLPYEVLSQIIPGLTQEHYNLFVTAIEHHGSDSLKKGDIEKGRPFRVAALGDNPLLVLMKLSDNLDMLRNRLNAVQSDPLFLETLGKMKSEAERIMKEYEGVLDEAKIKTLIEESNRKIKAEAFRRINTPDPANPGKTLYESDPAKYRLMEDIISGCNHESYPHFASVEFASNISVTIENGRIMVRLIYNTPLQFIPLEITGFQTARLADSQKATILELEKTRFHVDGVGEVEIRNGEIYIDKKDGKGFELFEVTPKTLAVALKIQEAISNASAKPQFTRVAPPPSARLLRAAKPKVERTKGIRDVELAMQYRVDHTGAFGPEYMQDRVSKGVSRAWLIINSSGLKKINDTYGHEHGNTYLRELYRQISEIAVEINAEIDGKVRIVRDGPNFAIELPEGVNPQDILKMFANRLHGRKIVIDIGGKKITVGMDLKYNILVFDADLTPEDVKRAVGENIHSLNKGEKTGQVEVVDAERIKRLRLSESIVDPATTKGLDKFETFEKRAIEGIIKMLEARRSGKAHSGSIAFFDGNWTGAFRNYGLAGEMMIDALFESFLPDIASELSREVGKKISICRWGPGSEEFYIYVDGADAKTMQDIMKRFMEKVVTKPFKIRVPVSELKITTQGQDFLEGRLPGTGKPVIRSHRYSDGQVLDVVELDVIQLLRGRGGLMIKGLPITAAIAEIVLPEIPLSPDRIFAMYKEAVDKAGEIAKEHNGTRGNLLVRLVEGGGYEIFVPSENEFRSPADISTRYRLSLMKKVEAFKSVNPELAKMLEGRLTAMTAEELAQVGHKDIADIAEVFKGFYGGKTFGIQEEQLVSDTMRRFGIPESAIKVVIDNMKGQKALLPTGAKASKFMSWLEKVWARYGNEIIFTENIQVNSEKDFSALRRRIELLRKFKVSAGSKKGIIVSGSDVYVIEIPRGHKLVQKGPWIYLNDEGGNTKRRFIMQGKYLKEVVAEGTEGGEVIRITAPREGVTSYKREQLLKLAASLRKSNPVLGPMIEEQIRAGNLDITYEEMVQLKKDLHGVKGKFNEEVEARVGKALLKLGFTEAKAEEMVDALRWRRLTYRYGKELVETLKKQLGRIQGKETPSLKGINLAEFISNIYKLSAEVGSPDWRIAEKYFRGLGFKAEEIDTLGQKSVAAKEHYIEEVRKRVVGSADFLHGKSIMDLSKETFETLESYRRLLESKSTELILKKTEIAELRAKVESAIRTKAEAIAKEITETDPLKLSELPLDKLTEYEKLLENKNVRANIGAERLSSLKAKVADAKKTSIGREVARIEALLRDKSALEKMTLQEFDKLLEFLGRKDVRAILGDEAAISLRKRTGEARKAKDIKVKQAITEMYNLVMRAKPGFDALPMETLKQFMSTLDTPMARKVLGPKKIAELKGKIKARIAALEKTKAVPTTDAPQVNPLDAVKPGDLSSLKTAVAHLEKGIGRDFAKVLASDYGMSGKKPGEAFELLRQITADSSMDLTEFAKKYKLFYDAGDGTKIPDVKRAEMLRLVAQYYMTNYTYYTNVLTIANRLGIQGITNPNFLADLTILIGRMQGIEIKPEELPKFLETEEGKRMRQDPKFQAKMEKLIQQGKAQRIGAKIKGSAIGEIGMETATGSLIWILAHLTMKEGFGVENPAVLLPAELLLMQGYSRILGDPHVQKALYQAGRDLALVTRSVFSKEAVYKGSYFAKYLGSLRAGKTVPQLALSMTKGVGLFSFHAVRGLGEFGLAVKGYDALLEYIGVEKGGPWSLRGEYGSMIGTTFMLAVVRNRVKALVLKELAKTLGSKELAGVVAERYMKQYGQRWMGKVIAEQIGTKSFVGVASKVLGPIAVALTVIEGLDMIRHIFFMNQFDHALEAERAKLNGTLADGTVWQDNFARSTLLGDATKTWMDQLMSIRHQAFLATYYTKDGVMKYDGKDKTIDPAQLSIPDEEIGKVIDDLTADYDEGIVKTAEGKKKKHQKLTDVEQKHLMRKEFRETMKYLMMVNPDNFSNSKAAMAIRDIQRLFDEEGRLKDRKGFISSVRSFPEMFMSATNYGKDPVIRFWDGAFYWSWIEGYKKTEGYTGYEEMLESTKEAQIMARLQYLITKTGSSFGTGQKVDYSPFDVKMGLVTSTGEINIGSPYYLRMMRAIIDAVKGDESLLKQLKLEVLRARMAYLTTKDENILKLIRIMGDNSDPSTWSLAKIKETLDYIGGTKGLLEMREKRYKEYKGMVDKYNAMAEKMRTGQASVDDLSVQMLGDYARIKEIEKEIAGIDETITSRLAAVDKYLEDNIRLFEKPKVEPYKGPVIKPYDGPAWRQG